VVDLGFAQACAERPAGDVGIKKRYCAYADLRAKILGDDRTGTDAKLPRVDPTRELLPAVAARSVAADILDFQSITSSPHEGLGTV
jgi:hypothetical protein